ncbi:MAG: hypothetical protein KAT79_03080 [candidate division Zixibacteria bacterium]|nr:hypothetical protein [candidate division Zixibacteria bacterium]
MDTTKNLSRPTLIVLSVVIIALLMPVQLFGADRWVNWTSFEDARRMRVIDDTLFIVTSGGLLAVTDPTLPGQQILNTDGLGTIDLADIIVDASGEKWVAGFGRLVRFDYENSDQFIFRDSEDRIVRLHCLFDDADLLWVGTEIGLVLFSKTLFGGQILDSYTLFGDLNAGAAVYDILLQDDSIWIATSVGLAVADRTNTASLKSPSAWTTFDIGDYPELGSEIVRNVKTFENELYVATQGGVFILDRDVDTSFVKIDIGPGCDDARLRVDNDSLFYYYSDTSGGGFGYIIDSTAQPLSTAGFTSYPLTGTGYDGSRWIAASGGGIFYESGGAYVAYPFTGLPGSDISDLTVNADGLVTAGFSSRPPAQFDGDSWTVRDFWVRGGTTDLMTDRDGRAWVGTEGNGIWILDDNQLINYDENNSTMRGNTQNPPVGPTWVFVNGMATDGRYIYMACFIALNDYPIAIADQNNLDNPAAWDSLGIDDGITTKTIIDLDYQDGYLAIGTEGSGVFNYYLGSNPHDRSDDTVHHWIADSVYLISDKVKAVEFAPNGELWVGTNLGVSRFDLGVDFFRTVELPAGVGPLVTDIEFDGRGSVWIGTISGLVRIDLVDDTKTVFNTLNSGLVSDHVNNVTFDRFTGRLYVATDAGISYLPSEIGTPTADVEEVIAFPNPFVISSSVDRLNFNFLARATVTIFTVAGEQVWEGELTADGWDGRNDAGAEVASGVYLFVLKDTDGHVGRGKFLLVRN